MLSAVRNRRPWVAALLAFFLTPAVGMAYLNRGWLASLYLLLLLLAVAVIAVLYPRLGPDSMLPLYVSGAAVTIIVAGTVHIAWIARWYDPSRRLRWYARYWQPLALVSFLWFAAGWAIPEFGYQAFHAASSSMSPSLNLGDHVLVSKYREEDFHPRRGDVVAFYRQDTGAAYLKRVVGLPGDSVQIQGGILFINGVPVSLRRLADAVEPCDSGSCRIPQYEETLPEGRKQRILKRNPFDAAESTDLYLLAEDGYFVMGDDRDNSFDSRHAGPVLRQDLIGRVVVRYITEGRWTWQPVN